MRVWKLCVVFVLALSFGIAIGWWVRDYVAVDDCLDAGGKWLPVAGHCSGSPWSETEV